MPQTRILVFQRADGRIPLEGWLTKVRKKDDRAHAKCLDRIRRLANFGCELDRPHAAPHRDGIRELRADSGNVNYRILYCFHGKNIAVLSHGLVKEGAVPPDDIDRALRNKKLVERDSKKYTAEWGVQR